MQLHPAYLGKSVISIKPHYAFTSSYIREDRLSLLFLLICGSSPTEIMKDGAGVKDRDGAAHL